MVSVVVPVYNGAAYLTECLDSVLGQSYDAWSCTIVDNASTDATPEIASVYAACGLDPDTQTDPLDRLRDIEQWLETLLASIQTMDTVKVEAAEKKKNAERREQIRAIKKEEQQRLYEERLAKSTARAKAEVVKQSGKQLMFRSPPIRKKKKKEDVEEIDEEAEELKRFFT